MIGSAENIVNSDSGMLPDEKNTTVQNSNQATGIERNAELRRRKLAQFALWVISCCAASSLEMNTAGTIPTKSEPRRAAPRQTTNTMIFLSESVAPRKELASALNTSPSLSSQAMEPYAAPIVPSRLALVMSRLFSSSIRLREMRRASQQSRKVKPASEARSTTKSASV